MIFPLRVPLLILVFYATLTFGQEKVVEGEYWVEQAPKSGTAEAKTVTNWVVYEKSPGYFRLDSEIENQPAGMRVVQIEELTDRFVPTSIGYDLYRKDQQIPSISAICDFTSGALVCTGNSGKDQASPSTPYKPNGAFWPWMEGLGALDLPWLLAGAVNMAHWDKGTAEITTLVVSGGSGVMIGDAVNIAKLQAIGKPLTVIAPDKPIPWSFRSGEETSFEFVASETMELNGKKIAVKHYSFTDHEKQGDIWITDSGLLTKLTAGGNFSFVLRNYKQHRKIIPELPVDPSLKDPY